MCDLPFKCTEEQGRETYKAKKSANKPTGHWLRAWAHPKVPQHLRASHSPRTVAPVRKVAYFPFLWVPVWFNRSGEAHNHLLHNSNYILQYLRPPWKKCPVLSKFIVSSYTWSISKNCKCTFPQFLEICRCLPVHILSQRTSDGKQNRETLWLG